MSEAKTIREDLEEHGFYVDEFTVDDRPLIDFLPHDYFDLHIIPGAGVVVSPAGLEAAAKGIFDLGRQATTWERLREGLKNEYRAKARAALEAAGIYIVRADKEE